MSGPGGHASDVVRLTGVEKRYGGQLVLRLDELTIRRGDRIALIGSNGSGKSTLLRILGRIAPVDRGQIWWAEGLRRGALGYAPQSGGMYGELTIDDNFDLRRRLYGLGGEDPATIALMGGFGLDPFRRKPFAELSGGYQRLAVVAAALHVEPTWVLLDEPFAGVDETKVDQIRRLLDLLTQRLDLLVITGQSSDVFPGANRLIEVRHGQLHERTGGDA